MINLVAFYDNSSYQIINTKRSKPLHLVLIFSKVSAIWLRHNHVTLKLNETSNRNFKILKSNFVCTFSSTFYITILRGSSQDTHVRQRRSPKGGYFEGSASYNAGGYSAGGSYRAGRNSFRSLNFDEVDFELSDVEVRTKRSNSKYWYIYIYIHNICGIGSTY